MAQRSPVAFRSASQIPNPAEAGDADSVKGGRTLVEPTLNEKPLPDSLGLAQ